MVDFTAHTARMINRLGGPVSITPAGGQTRVVSGVFVQDPAIAFGMVDGTRPTVRLTTQDADGAAYGDPVSVNGQEYTVARLHRDPAAGDVLIDLEAV